MTADRIVKWHPPKASFEMRMRWRALLAAAEARVLSASIGTKEKE